MLTSEAVPTTLSFIPTRLSKAVLRERIAALSSGRVVVVGDLLIDELLEGRPERISREAPVLILEHVDTQLIPGGAANTAANIAALGGKCHAIGVCGGDQYAEKMANLFEQRGITYKLIEDRLRPTTVKTRILSSTQSFRQQLLRLDRISHEPVTSDIAQKLVEAMEEAAPEHQAIVLSDYRGGVMTEPVINACSSTSRQHKLKLFVDAQDNLKRFGQATLMTPNQPDAEAMVGFTIDSQEALQRAGEILLTTTAAEAILITRGAHGMALFEKQKEPYELPVFNRSEVFDVSGAGDTVIATAALSLVTGATFIEAMALGNLAAGIVVKKPGTATTTQAEMLEALESISIDA